MYITRQDGNQGDQIGRIFASCAITYIFAKTSSSLSKKRQYFRPNFSAKFFNHNIGLPATCDQGCQIFLGTKFQNGKKYTKLPQTIPNVHKI
jgi:hypothetical protein